MKKRYLALACALLVSGAVVMGMGYYLKYQVLKPLDLVQDQEPAALPFLLAADAGLRCALADAWNAPEPTAPTAVTTVPVTQPELTVPPTTIPATEPPETVPEITEPAEPQPAEPVDESWYDDVLFIGDSRTVGLRDYGRRGNADYFCSVGMTVFNYSQRRVFDEGFNKQYLKSLLEAKTYGKILIGLGINECGYPIEKLMNAYQGLIELVREKQPDAVIILEGIMTVSRSKARSKTYFHLDNIESVNERIAAFADNKTIFYIDVNDQFADEEGYLPDEMSEDGCHLYAEYYEDWADWISYAVAQLGI